MCSCACGFALDLECRNDLELTHGSFLHSSLCKHANNLTKENLIFCISGNLWLRDTIFERNFSP